MANWSLTVTQQQTYPYVTTATLVAQTQLMLIDALTVSLALEFICTTIPITPNGLH